MFKVRKKKNLRRNLLRKLSKHKSFENKKKKLNNLEIKTPFNLLILR